MPRSRRTRPSFGHKLEIRDSHFMIIPSWALLGLYAALITTAIPLIQERLKAEGFAVAMIVKFVACIAMVPFVITHGFPDNPKFYYAVAITSVLWAISDVIYFRSIPKVGAGVVTRLLPSAVILSFILWFFIDPALLEKYRANPLQASLIAGIILLSAWFASRLKNCAVSWKGFRVIWFVIFAACVGPLIEKMTLGYAPVKQAPFAFVFVQACFMLCCYLLYYMVRKPVSRGVLLSPLSLKAGILIGLCSAAGVTFRFMALQEPEHPAYLSVILFTDALWVVLFHRLIGKSDNSNIWAGLGIVFCAIALTVVKSLDLHF